MAGRGTLKRTKRRDGGVSDASEEKKVSSATKSEAYNAVSELSVLKRAGNAVKNNTE